MSYESFGEVKLTSINNATDEDIWGKSALNNKTDVCNEIWQSKKSEELKETIKESNLDNILEKKLSDQIQDVVSKDLNSAFRVQKEEIPFYDYREGLKAVESYLKNQFGIKREADLENIYKLDRFTKEVFKQKELTKLSIAVYKKKDNHDVPII